MLQNNFMVTVQKNISLKPYHTFGITVYANYFVAIQNELELAEVFKSNLAKTEQLLVLGGGSNLLFTKNFEGLVIKINLLGISYEVYGNNVFVTAGAGVVWNDFVDYCVVKGFAGVENLTLIPGTVGAAPIQNIGAYGVELKDIFKSCTAFEVATGKITTFNYNDCAFGYRESIFKNEYKGKYVITSVTFKLNKIQNINTQYGAIRQELAQRQINKPTIADVSAVVAHIRVSKLPDPKTIGNAGSFFKNPIVNKQQFDTLLAQFPEIVNYPAGNHNIKLAAGWLIEQCGFKGKVSGQTGTWKNQALVLVNHGEATGQEVYNFSELIITTVYQKFAVKLEREVNTF